MCDSAAAGACPLYFGNSIKVHWGLSDPSKFAGVSSEQELAFLACINEIRARVKSLNEIASKHLEKRELKIALAAIGAYELRANKSVKIDKILFFVFKLKRKEEQYKVASKSKPIG
ncbi:MAG: hypothetical protein ACI82S_002174 [Patiriisocius sp.]